MDSENAPARREWRFCLWMGALLGVLPVAVLLAVYFFAGNTDVLDWPGFTPSPLLFISGWGVCVFFSAASILFYARVCLKIPRGVWVLWVLRAVLTAGWLGVLWIQAEISFVLLIGLTVVSGLCLTVRRPFRLDFYVASAVAGCPAVLWGFYNVAVVYVALLRTA